MQSHPLWVRGLKLTLWILGGLSPLSHPLWVRGLKRNVNAYQRYLERVASFMGAWIETQSRLYPKVRI